MGRAQKRSRQPGTGQGSAPDGSCANDSPPDGGNALASLGAELLRRSQESQPGLETAWNELMATWGIRGEPISIERLRAMIAADCGADPADNSFSRELIDMRQVRRS